MAYKISDACVSCGACAANCPVEAITEGDGQYVIDPEKCISCGACAENCPVGAPPRNDPGLTATVKSRISRLRENRREMFLFRAFHRYFLSRVWLCSVRCDIINWKACLLRRTR